MRKMKITVNTFKKMAQLQDDLARQMMPRVSASDPVALAPVSAQRAARVIAVSGTGLRLVKPLTATLAEVVQL